MTTSHSVDPTPSDSNNNAFNFEAWIENNGLGAIKSTFIENGMCSLHTLSLQNPAFPDLMNSITAHSPSLSGTVVEAMQRIPRSSDIIKKIKATEQEFEVEESMMTQIEKSQQLHSSIDSMHRTLKASMSRKTEMSRNIAVIQQQIMDQFDRITSRTAESRSAILKELNQHRNDQKQKTANLESKIMEINQVRNAIAAELESQHNELAKVRSLLEDHAMNRKERKMEIIRIGQRTSYRFESKHNGFQQSLDALTAAMSDDAEADDVMIALHAVSMNKITKHLTKFGKLKYRAFEMAEQKTSDLADAASTEAPSTVTPQGVCSGKEKEGELHGVDESDLAPKPRSEKEKVTESLRAEANREVEALNAILSDKIKCIEAMKGRMTAMEENVVRKETKCKELKGLHETLRIRHRDLEQLVSTKDAMIRSMTKSERTLKHQMEAMERRLEDQQSIMDTADALKLEVKRLETELTKSERTADGMRKVIQLRSDENAKLKTISLRLNEALQTQREETKSMEPGSAKWAEYEMLQNQMAEREEAHFVAMEEGKREILKLRESEEALKSELKRQRIEFNKQRMEWHKAQRLKLQNNLNSKPNKATNQRVKGVSPRTWKSVQRKKDGVNQNGNKNQGPNRNRFGAVISKLKKYEGCDPRGYVEDFCQIGKYGKPKVTTKKIESLGYKCTIEISKARLKHSESSKERLDAIDKCYKRLAANLRNGNV